mmetsp:Transcript_32940/g.84758  ORF Transcript_32940/g.84758 Transcript_32940/m.84758 type:complete len:251 (-) Transcript_32940:293-1045(-)
MPAEGPQQRKHHDRGQPCVLEQVAPPTRGVRGLELLAARALVLLRGGIRGPPIAELGRHLDGAGHNPCPADIVEAQGPVDLRASQPRRLLRPHSEELRRCVVAPSHCLLLEFPRKSLRKRKRGRGTPRQHVLPEVEQGRPFALPCYLDGPSIVEVASEPMQWLVQVSQQDDQPPQDARGIQEALRHVRQALQLQRGVEGLPRVAGKLLGIRQALKKVRQGTKQGARINGALLWTSAATTSALQLPCCPKP